MIMVISGLCHSWSFSSHAMAYVMAMIMAKEPLQDPKPRFWDSRTVEDNEAWPDPPSIPQLL